MTYQICTQLVYVPLNSVQEEACNSQTSYLSYGQTITVTGPELTTNESCPSWEFKSRIKTASHSTTSNPHC